MEGSHIGEAPGEQQRLKTGKDKDYQVTGKTPHTLVFHISFDKVACSPIWPRPCVRFTIDTPL